MSEPKGKCKQEKEENQTEFDRQQDAWFRNNCQGNIEDYVEEE